MRKPRFVLLVVLLVCALTMSAQAAFADQVYQAQHIDLMPVDGAPLRTGFVENIHANGPTIYAHEVYVLNGAKPNTTYEVALNGYIASATCSGDPEIVIASADLMTNMAGNGKAQKFFYPSDVEGLHGMTVHIVWTVTMQGETSPAYTSSCQTVMLD